MKLQKYLRTMRVRNEFLDVLLGWEKRGVNWVCVMAGPPLESLVGLHPIEIKKELVRRDCSWEWLEASAVASTEAQVALPPHQVVTPPNRCLPPGLKERRGFKAWKRKQARLRARNQWSF